jgi:hypothetical protein
MNIYGIDKIQKDFQNGSYYRALFLNDINSGINGEFSACLGWDPTTGLGSFSKYMYVASATQTSNTLTIIDDLFSKQFESNTISYEESRGARELLAKETTGKIFFIKND